MFSIFKEEKFWLSLPDPRKSIMFRSFRNFYAFMTVTYIATWFICGFENKDLPNNLLYMWLIYSSHYFFLTTRAGWAIKDPGNGDNSETKNVNRFKGWFFVILPWVAAWIYGLLMVVSEVWMENINLKFFATEIYSVLAVVTAMFNITDSARNKIAKNLENQWAKLLGEIFERIFSALRVLVKKQPVEKPADVKKNK